MRNFAQLFSLWAACLLLAGPTYAQAPERFVDVLIRGDLTVEGQTRGNGLATSVASASTVALPDDGNYITITGNTSPTNTGGFRCESNVDTLIRNCLIADNTGNVAGGLLLMGFGAFAVTTSTISGNVSVSFGGGGIRAFGTVPTSIENSILWGNDAPEGAQLMLDSGFNNPTVLRRPPG